MRVECLPVELDAVDGSVWRVGEAVLDPQRLSDEAVESMDGAATGAHRVRVPTPSAPSASPTRTVMSSNAVIGPCVLSDSATGSGMR
jgi:hypothetical protein